MHVYMYICNSPSHGVHLSYSKCVCAKHMGTSFNFKCYFLLCGICIMYKYIGIYILIHVACTFLLFQSYVVRIQQCVGW